MSERLPSRQEALNLLIQSGCAPNVVKHCRIVSDYAVKLAKAFQKKDRNVDVRLVEIAGLLHDIGRSKTHSVDHALVGAQIARSLRLPDSIVLIIERHAGGGIPRDEARSLGWPVKDYVPQSLEEKIVCYADKRVEGLRTVPIEQTIKAYAASLGKKHPAIKRIRQLHREISTVVGNPDANSDAS